MPREPEVHDPDEWRDLEARFRVLVRGETVAQGAYCELRAWLHRMQSHRLQAGLSLEEVARRAGLEVGYVGRLEHGEEVNPTLDLLARYALALDHQVTLGSEPLAEEHRWSHAPQPLPPG